jgi:hypothetical protein
LELDSRNGGFRMLSGIGQPGPMMSQICIELDKLDFAWTPSWIGQSRLLDSRLCMELGEPGWWIQNAFVEWTTRKDGFRICMELDKPRKRIDHCLELDNQE